MIGVGCEGKGHLLSFLIFLKVQQGEKKEGYAWSFSLFHFCSTEAARTDNLKGQRGCEGLLFEIASGHHGRESVVEQLRLWLKELCGGGCSHYTTHQEAERKARLGSGLRPSMAQPWGPASVSWAPPRKGSTGSQNSTPAGTTVRSISL